MNLFKEVEIQVIEALKIMVTEGQLPEGLSFENVTVDPPRDPLHGDMATNAAMVLAKPAKMKPRDIADMLAAHLVKLSEISTADVAGPGFLNLRLTTEKWTKVIPCILAEQANFGMPDMGKSQKVNVEYVSTNPTGPLHIGHTRGAVFGDTLANLLEYAGYSVTREYYVNDGGAQVDVLARSAYLRYLEANGQEIEFMDGTYPGDYLVAVGKGLKEKYGDELIDQPEEIWLSDVRLFATNAMMDMIRSDLELLGINMDIFFSEKSLYGCGKIEETLATLDDKGLIYQGYLEPPKGKLPDDWEPREQTLFKSTAHGDDVDRPVKKSDGSWTYFAPDIAYHYDKIQRGFVELIDVLGADHGGYVKRMKAAVSALSDGKVPLDIKLVQLVKLYKNGVPFKMSKRTGNFVTLREVIDRVGRDATRFAMISRKNDAPLDFDFDKVTEQSKDNPVFYVQYAHARVCSVLKKAKEAGFDVSNESLINANFEYVSSKSEMNLIKKMAEWPRLVEVAAKHREPHRIAFYLYDLASDFHSLWSEGKTDPTLKMIAPENEKQTQAKIALANALGVVISSGLVILGVTPAKTM